MRTPLSGDGDAYPRPNQPWHCGLAEEGPPCPLGPSPTGACPAAAACRPEQQGDRWVCNRSDLRGGPCDAGPSPEGACPHTYACSPRRTMRTRRGRFLTGVALAALGAAAMTLSASWRNEVIAPGPLSSHHAQLVARQSNTKRCAACHAAGNATTAQWWDHTRGRESLAPMQAVLCLECHRRQIDPEFALAAHTTSSESLPSSSGSAASRTRDPAAAIACSACHREHHGVDHDLAAVSNQSCQACHQRPFHSFASDHPDFEDWPFQQATSIQFDHASHQGKHFPKDQQIFSCKRCHQADPTGRGQITLPYEAACASCHEAAVKASLAEGVPLLTLPMLDGDLLAEAGSVLRRWPAEATGDFDGQAPALLRLLLLGDDDATSAARVLGDGLDLYDVDIDEPAHLKAAGDYAVAVQRLIDDLAQRGRPALADRLQAVLGRPPSDAELASLTGNLSPDTINGLVSKWFEGSGQNGPANQEPSPERLPGGGWLRDDAVFALRYYPRGHADPWLTAWLEAAVAAANGSRGERAEPLAAELFRPTGPGLCGSCHIPRQDSEGDWSISWWSARPEAHARGFTHFSHGPHLVQPQLADCTSCHQIDAASAGDGFAPMTRQSCAECHTPQAAGDRCTQCHNYHVR